MVCDSANAYVASDVRDDFSPERKTHKKRSGAIRTPDFVADAIKNQRNGQQQTIYRIVKEDL